MNHDQTKGSLEQVKGEVKKQFGKLTDNQSKEAEGNLDKAKGKVQEKFGDAKEKVARTFNDRVDD